MMQSASRNLSCDENLVGGGITAYRTYGIHVLAALHCSGVPRFVEVVAHVMRCAHVAVCTKDFALPA